MSIPVKFVVSEYPEVFFLSKQCLRTDVLIIKFCEVIIHHVVSVEDLFACAVNLRYLHFMGILMSYILPLCLFFLSPYLGYSVSLICGFIRNWA